MPFCTKVYSYFPSLTTSCYSSSKTEWLNLAIAKKALKLLKALPKKNKESKEVFFLYGKSLNIAQCNEF